MTGSSKTGADLHLPDELVLDSIEQVRALGHPLRQRILDLLVDAPRTNQQLGAQLDESPARLHFHVRRLAAAGLIALVEERSKGGVREKYYRAVARRYRLGRAMAGAADESAAVEQAALGAAAQTLARAIERHGGRPSGLRMTQQQARLSARARDRVQAHLDAIDEEFARAPQSLAEEPAGPPVILTYLLHELPSDA